MGALQRRGGSLGRHDSNRKEKTLRYGDGHRYASEKGAGRRSGRQPLRREARQNEVGRSNRESVNHFCPFPRPATTSGPLCVLWAFRPQGLGDSGGYHRSGPATRTEENGGSKGQGRHA